MGNFPEGAARGGYPTVRGVHLLPPLDYLAFINLMRQAGLVLTDSGSVIEEAATLRKPLLIMRRVTE